MVAPPFVSKTVDASAQNEADSLAQAAYMTNLQYRMTNNPETLTESERVYARTQADVADAASEAAKHRIAFSQPRNDLNVPRSERFLAITKQYELQKYAIVGPETTVYHPETKITPVDMETKSAADIAKLLSYSGGRTNIYLESKARA